MQEYGGVSSKSGEYRDGGPEGVRERGIPHQGDGYQPQHQYAVMPQKNYGKTLFHVFKNFLELFSNFTSQDA